MRKEEEWIEREGEGEMIPRVEIRRENFLYGLLCLSFDQIFCVILELRVYILFKTLFYLFGILFKLITGVIEFSL